MNSISERDRKLAEALKPLSPEPSGDQARGLSAIPRWLVISAAALVLATVSILGVPYYWPDALERIGSERLDQQNDPGVLAIAGEKPGVPAAPANPPNADPLIDNRALASRDITGSGYVVAPHLTSVYAKYAGRIDHVGVDVGDHVEAGQVLIRLEDADARFALEQAKSDRVAADLQRAAAEIDLTLARASFTRIKQLAASHAVSRQHIEEAGSASERAENAVARARQVIAKAALAIRMAEERIGELSVRAPFAGTITRLGVHVGDSVLARPDSVRDSQSLLTITDTQNMVIDADVAEANIALLQPGLRGEAVLDAFPGRPFAIEIMRLAPAVSAEKGTINLRLSLTAPPTGIRPSMAARIRIPVLNPDDHPHGETTQ